MIWKGIYSVMRNGSSSQALEASADPLLLSFLIETRHLKQAFETQARSTLKNSQNCNTMFNFFSSVLPRVVGDTFKWLKSLFTRLVSENEPTTTVDRAYGGPELASQRQSLVSSKNDDDQELSANGWTESLALAGFSGLDGALQNMLKIKSVLIQMTRGAAGYARQHPVQVTLLTVGILLAMAPFALEALGFAALGPVQGSFAAWWQATFAGFVPQGSLFSIFQRMGMICRWWRW